MKGPILLVALGWLVAARAGVAQPSEYPMLTLSIRNAKSWASMMPRPISAEGWISTLKTREDWLCR